MAQFWPDRLWLIRHGQSQGNVARDAAEAAAAATIDIDMRDVDVPLSDLGHAQAKAAGAWFAALPESERPEVILSSPYLRARQTARHICEQGGLAGGKARTVIDERLREREFGVFDGLTSIGIKQNYPAEAAHRARLGKFYHRAPGGESWADVILRLRSAMNSINLQYADRRVLIVCHQVVVFCMRYILEELDEAQIMEIDKQSEIYNCGICAFDFQPDDLAAAPTMALWNHAAPPLDRAAPVTSEPDAMVASR